MVGALIKLRNNQQACELGLFFVLCCLLWGAANWPGLGDPWWYADDFPFAMTMQHRPTRAFDHALGGGRPLQIPWLYTQLLDGVPDRVVENIALRSLGGLLHALSATLAGGLLWQATGRKAALAGALPFLLWPFNAEVVLWRTAAYYCLASSISLVGAYLLLPAPVSHLKRAIGVACIAGSMLTHQIAGLAGLVVGVLYVALVQLRCVGSIRDLVVRRGALMSLGYLLGGFASLALARLVPMARAEVPLVVMDKLAFLLKLNKLFLAPDQFPWWLVAAQTAMVVIPVLLMVAEGGGDSARQKRWLAVVMVLATVITPYATLMLVGENWPSWRTMYVAPFLFGGGWCLMLTAAVGRSRRVRAAWALLVIVLISYGVIAWRNSAEYVQVFQRDLAYLDEIERQAHDQGLTSVTVATWPDYLRSWNPYGLVYMHGDSKLSVYSKAVFAYPFLSWFSELDAGAAEPGYSDCVSTCREGRGSSSVEFAAVAGGKVLCVCP